MINALVKKQISGNQYHGSHMSTSSSSIIEQNSKIATLINVFTVEPRDQQRLVEILIEATKKVMSQQEGFISANIHKSIDGTKIVNYAQWKSREAFEKMLKNPRAIIHMNEALSIAKVDGSLYDVVFVDKV
jgi:quinol monooxygenase YgiN